VREKKIQEAVLRAKDKGLFISNQLNLFMDVHNCVINGEIDIDKLNASNGLDFAHDIIGIQKNINRVTKKLDNHFVPRCA